MWKTRITVVPLFFAAALLSGSFIRGETLTFEERVDARRAIEEVYWRHRIWPKGNPAPKPPLAELMPDDMLAAKVEDTLAKTAALDALWNRPVTPERLQSELERMARSTRNPEMLHELFAALDNDPVLLAECLARPILVNRLIRSAYAYDPRFHGELRAGIDEKLELVGSVEQMELLGGEYREIEIVARPEESAEAAATPLDDDPGKMELDPDAWRRLVQGLADAFGVVGRTEPRMDPSPEAEGRASPLLSTLERIPLRRLSGLIEKSDGYVVHAVLERTATGMHLATVTWPKQSFDAWWKEARHHLQEDGEWWPRQKAVSGEDESAPAGGSFRVPTIEGTGCMPDEDDVWYPVGGAWEPRSQHTAVWATAEMIVWGGWNGTDYLNTGGMYNPFSENWSSTSLGANVPSPRRYHTAVWTGTEMIVWGGWDGSDSLDTGGRYDPSTDSWTPLPIAGAPTKRWAHTAVWTGYDMIIWGGFDFSTNLNTGGVYRPMTDAWRPTPTLGAPDGRRYHTAVFTGDVMIVWGGYGDAGHLQSGGRYHPFDDEWRPPTRLSGAPSARRYHTAVWAELRSEMIVWGGYNIDEGNLRTGGRYDPNSNLWSPVLEEPGVPQARHKHTAVWTGDVMIVWGGSSGSAYLNTGGRYDPDDPNGDCWRSTSTGANVPSGRWEHTAVWKGAEMIVWGGADGSGSLSTGGLYDPVADLWNPNPPDASLPSKRTRHTAVWTGTEMILWGGSDGVTPLKTGERYDPATDTWSPTSTGTAPAARQEHTAVWTGTEMIVWGGSDGTNLLNSGARYDPEGDSWSALSPLTWAWRRHHTAVWTGTKMVVWGGIDVNGDLVDDGLRYDPELDNWSSMGSSTAISARRHHTAVWTGTEMIVWGGDTGFIVPTNTGGRYDPPSNSWIPLTAGTAVWGRKYHTAVWTGTEMIVWGGTNGSGNMKDGWRYDPNDDTWSPTLAGSTAPSDRQQHTAVWTGNEMIVWGGSSGTGSLNTGGRYNPLSNSWLSTSTGARVPRGRYQHTAVWTGTEMAVAGGEDGAAYMSGGRYCVCSSNWFEDSDGDLFGNPGALQGACTQPPGYVVNADDCDDGHASVHPGATQICDGLNNDCDDAAWPTPPDDEVDLDLDTFFECQGDCDDEVSTVYPGAPQICDGLNNDCDHPSWPGLTSTNEFDDDGDTYSECDDDCDDALSTVYPGAPQICDGLNNDCDHPSWPGLTSTNEFDDDGDTYSECDGDCDLGDGQVWGTPGEVTDLFLDYDDPNTVVTITWNPPLVLGATSVLYDAIRSQDPADHVTGATCTESDDADTTCVDWITPPPGVFYLYFIRAENACPAYGGGGRPGRDCP